MISLRVKAARESAGRSQKSVADEMRSRGHKWSQATVWSVEKGERALRLSEATDLTEILGITLDLLAYGSSAPTVDEWRTLVHQQDKALRHIEQAVRDAVAGRVN